MKIEIEATGKPSYVGDRLVTLFEEATTTRVRALVNAGKPEAANREETIYRHIAYALMELRENIQYSRGSVAITLAVECDP